MARSAVSRPDPQGTAPQDIASQGIDSPGEGPARPGGAFLPRSVAQPRRASLAVQVCDDLSARIEAGELRPGDKLPTEKELITRYGVSRTVVREAISSLRAAGRLSVEQGRGMFMLAPPQAPHYRLEASQIDTAEEMLRLIEVRVALESEAAWLAAQRRGEAQAAALLQAAERFGTDPADADGSVAMDRTFHLQIAGCCGNAYFEALLAGLPAQLVPRSRLELFRDAEARAAYLRILRIEHVQIATAILHGDAEGARAAMRLHLLNSRERLREAVSAFAAG
ncbi:FadR/GntR family transcriptional regulator [Roseomonas sp. FDAARGOS_362]|uniref:FadR/GntR family transcriptional regulator n=1 Tax=Roseomonas sp. FDAARGOS_362 TaxID=2018065 RepID=UPI001D0274C4|nr:FadR/GntR family transcriptional regulator [Roseomonas sp. FDAARGOS_362]